MFLSATVASDGFDIQATSFVGSTSLRDADPEPTSVYNDIFVLFAAWPQIIPLLRLRP